MSNVKTKTEGATIKMSDLSFSFKGKSGSRLPIFECQNLSISPSTLVAVVGRSGCGKTTLLKLLSGLLTPDRGSIFVNGLAPNELIRKRDIALAFQRPHLLRWRTVLWNVELPGRLWNSERMVANAKAALELMGLEKYADANPTELSIGMQARVALARTWCQNPKLLLLDEPFAALDEIGRDRLNLKLQRLWLDQRFTGILVTHSIAEAVYLADRVIVIGPKPQGVIGDFDINLPRPRSHKVLEDQKYLVLVRQIRELLESNNNESGE